ncbi:MAG TPA: phosphate ABC transporter permease subunit PstC [Steroidobacteraceae bacterium]|nr:phosphate ABC transporter permease subunit PstC [Steroidobacteraceae bacterium]
MQSSTIVIVILVLSAVAYRVGRRRSLALVGGPRSIRDLHSLPSYYGFLTALWCALPALLLLCAWHLIDQRLILETVLSHMPGELQRLPDDQRGLLMNDVRNVVQGNVPIGEARPAVQAAAREWLRLDGLSRVAGGALALCLGLAGGAFAWWRISPTLRARNRVEKVVEIALVICSLIAILTTIGIVLSVLYEALQFFRVVPLTEFLFGTHWSPQMAIRSDQVGSSGAFGAVPLFAGTLLISLIAMLVAVPVGLLAAIYLAEYADRRIRAVTKPFLEVLAGIPTVVYGFFAVLTVGPLLRSTGQSLGLDVASESALSAGLVMGIMIIPFVSSLADDMITAVPQSLRDGAYALGATRSETIRRVVLPAALPGIVGGVLLAVSRAIGETMIVVMAAGLAAKLTANPLEAVTTVTVQIVALLIGDNEFNSPKTLSAFALGLVLFVATLLLNILALTIVRKYREHYE